jgi:hypothetical protein
MTNRESPEKKVVEKTDELLQKSRRLIDELEFILNNLHNDSQQPDCDRPGRDRGSRDRGSRDRGSDDRGDDDLGSDDPGSDNGKKGRIAH